MEGLYDVIVVGAGPAGLTAALYLARAKYRVLVLEKSSFGGQIAITDEVVNYPGIEKISGSELTRIMRDQAEAFGAEFLTAEATGFDLSGDIRIVRTDKGELRCFGIVLATGARPRTVGFVGEAQWRGRGVAYCATCDGEFFTGRELFVVGGGYAAAEESLFLTKFATHVTVLVRKDDFSCAASIAQKVKDHPKITVLTNTVLEEVAGEQGLTYARYRNTASGEVTEYRNPDTFGVFVFAGYVPDTACLRGVVELNEQGYIVTDATQKTDVEGVYAAGDVCIKPLRQVVTATADGALAATELEKYAAKMQQKTRLHPTAPKKSEPTRETRAEASTFGGEMRQQLDSVFVAMERPLLLKLYLDAQSHSAELEQFVTELAAMTDKLNVEVAARDADADSAPCVAVCRADGSPTGIAFHGIPGGHEFTSFVLGLYNAAGAGQGMDADIEKRLAAITRPVDMKILVTLSCSMCPGLVQAAQQFAAKNENITAQVYDIRLFPRLREQYRVMSVPCLIVNDTAVSFGKKDAGQLLNFLEQNL